MYVDEWPTLLSAVIVVVVVRVVELGCAALMYELQGETGLRLVAVGLHGATAISGFPGLRPSPYDPGPQWRPSLPSNSKGRALALPE